VPELEQVELRERPLADRDRLLRRAGADVKAEEIEEIEKGVLVPLPFEALGDHLLEQLLRLLCTTQSFQKECCDEHVSQLCIGPRLGI